MSRDAPDASLLEGAAGGVGGEYAPTNLNPFIDAADEWRLILSRNSSRTLGSAYSTLYGSIGVVAAFLLGQSIADVGNKNPEFHPHTIWAGSDYTALCEVYQSLLGCNFVATITLLIWSLQIAAQLAQTPSDQAKGLLRLYGFYRVQGGWLLMGLVVVLFLMSQMLKLSIACSRLVFLITLGFMVLMMSPLLWQTRSVVMIKQEYLRGLAEQTE